MTDEQRFLTCIQENLINRQILELAPQLGVSDWWLTAGALFQTVWKVLDAGDPGAGIRDCDLFHFGGDTSYAAEDAVIRRARELFKDVPAEVEVRNEARVHRPVHTQNRAEPGARTRGRTQRGLRLSARDVTENGQVPFQRLVAGAGACNPCFCPPARLPFFDGNESRIFELCEVLGEARVREINGVAEYMELAFIDGPKVTHDREPHRRMDQPVEFVAGMGHRGRLLPVRNRKATTKNGSEAAAEQATATPKSSMFLPAVAIKVLRMTQHQTARVSILVPPRGVARSLLISRTSPKSSAKMLSVTMSRVGQPHGMTVPPGITRTPAAAHTQGNQRASVRARCCARAAASREAAAFVGSVMASTLWIIKWM